MSFADVSWPKCEGVSRRLSGKAMHDDDLLFFNRHIIIAWPFVLVRL